MKKYLSLIIAAALVVAGLIGTLVTVSPVKTAEYKVVEKYIKAVNDCDSAKMAEYFPATEISSILGSATEGHLGTQTETLVTKKDYISAAGLSISSFIPDDAEVGDLKIITYKQNPISSGGLLAAQSAGVSIVLAVDYVSAEGETVNLTYSDFFTVSKTQSGYKIVS